MLGSLVGSEMCIRDSTKAAAAEMQNRLFKTLGEWAMLGDDALRRALGLSLIHI